MDGKEPTDVFHFLIQSKNETFSFLSTYLLTSKRITVQSTAMPEYQIRITGPVTNIHVKLLKGAKYVVTSREFGLLGGRQGGFYISNGNNLQIYGVPNPTDAIVSFIPSEALPNYVEFTFETLVAPGANLVVEVLVDGLVAGRAVNEINTVQRIGL